MKLAVNPLELLAYERIAEVRRMILLPTVNVQVFALGAMIGLYAPKIGGVHNFHPGDLLLQFIEEDHEVRRNG